MKKIFIPILALAVIQTGCLGSLIRNSIKDTPIANKMIIHSGARVGDYAVLQGPDGKSQITMRIKRYAGSLLVIETDTSSNLFRLGMSSVAKIEIWATRSGSIRRGYLIDGTERIPLKIAKYGQNGYLKKIRLSYSLKKKLGITNKIKVPAGTYYIKATAFKSTKDTRDQISVYMTSRRVKFLQVATYVFLKDPDGEYQRVSSMELVKQGRR